MYQIIAYCVLRAPNRAKSANCSVKLPVVRIGFSTQFTVKEAAVVPADLSNVVRCCYVVHRLVVSKTDIHVVRFGSDHSRNIRSIKINFDP